MPAIVRIKIELADQCLNEGNQQLDQCTQCGSAGKI